MLRLRPKVAAAAAVVSVALTGCGNWFVDDSYIKEARSRANDPRLSQLERGRIFESAGDTAVAKGRSGFAAEMYFEAAGHFFQARSPVGDLALRSINNKCSLAYRSSPYCEGVSDLMRERSLAARPDVPRRSETTGGGPSTSIAAAPAPSGPAVQPSSSDRVDGLLRFHPAARRTSFGHILHGTPRGLACIELTGRRDQRGREVIRFTCQPLLLVYCAINPPDSRNVDSPHCRRDSVYIGYHNGQIVPAYEGLTPAHITIPIGYGGDGFDRNLQSIFVASLEERCAQNLIAIRSVPNGWLSACHVGRDQYDENTIMRQLEEARRRAWGP